MNLDFNIEEFNIPLIIIFPLVICFSLLPLIKILAYKFILLDKPDYRKIHKKALPNIGGLGIFISYLICIFPIKYFTNIDFENFYIILLSSTIILLIGLADDVYNLSFKIRLGIQFLISAFNWSNGISISNINFDLLNYGRYNFEIPNFISLILTFLWISGIINAINWIDGINGLSSGVVILILIGVAKIAYTKKLISLFLITLILIGSCLGFLIHNLKPNNIIMGDNGSNFLGFNLAILCLYAGSDSDIYKENLSLMPLIPIFLLGFPCLDMVRVIYKRIRNKRSPFLPDKNHMHHLLLDLKFSNIKTILFIFSLTIYSISICFLFTDLNNKIIIFILANLNLLLFLLISRRKLFIRTG